MKVPIWLHYPLLFLLVVATFFWISIGPDSLAGSHHPVDQPIVVPQDPVREVPSVPESSSTLEEKLTSEPALPSSSDQDDQMVFPLPRGSHAGLSDTYGDARSGGRLHQGIDILASRGTPVLAAQNGRVVRLSEGRLGGRTIYLFGARGEYCYYYAHLEGYVDGLREGAQIEAGEVIGYVGTSGNAPVDTPHLHFEVRRLGPGKKWWTGESLNPYPLLQAALLSG